ncbi:MAG: SDR family oxidoreductase [Candidatus Kapabacteria bacterium]|nr:SDR family oxidoreductase [Candidatus Kapabacteria bacterium]
MKKILIIGAASAIATETAICFAREGASLFLSDISESRLAATRDHIFAHYQIEIKYLPLDLTQFDQHQRLFDEAVGALDGLDSILIAHGTLPDQLKSQSSAEAVLREFTINCTSVISLLTIASNYFESKNEGCIAAISSVAGDRGRGSNYIYGSAKGAVSLFMQGLRSRFSRTNIKIITIKPGFVDTPMTSHLPKNFLFASAKAVGEGIYEAMSKGKEIAYTPSWWRLIMFFVKHIPESIFKKLKF